MVLVSFFLAGSLLFMSAFDPLLLQPGDALGYRSHGFYGLLQAIKTWERAVGHIEVYVGENKTVGSRWPKGVRVYDFDTEDLTRVWRPVGGVDVDTAQKWFYGHAEGQKYDLLGQLVFYLAIHHGSRRRMWCSEFATRWYRAGRFQPFAPDWDADKTAPATFMVPPPKVFDLVWKA